MRDAYTGVGADSETWRRVQSVRRQLIRDSDDVVDPSLPSEVPVLVDLIGLEQIASCLDFEEYGPTLLSVRDAKQPIGADWPARVRDRDFDEGLDFCSLGARGSHRRQQFDREITHLGEDGKQGGGCTLLRLLNRSNSGDGYEARPLHLGLHG